MGLGGIDTISGRGGADAICGGPGDDDLWGWMAPNIPYNAENRAAFGDDGDDFINGGSGRDEVAGRDGDDNLNGGEDPDWFISGGPGDDTIHGGPSDDFEFAAYVNAESAVEVDLSIAGSAQATQSEGSDTLINIEGLMGSAHDDHLIGSEFDDYFIGNGGDDVIDAGDGEDYMDYTYSPGGVDVDLSGATPGATGADGNDDLLDVESIVGSCHADEVVGDSEDNTIFGRGASDTIDGGDGSDAIHGDDVPSAFSCAQYGHDAIHGGAGTDLLAGGLRNDLIDGGAGGSDAVTFEFMPRRVGGARVYLEGGTASGEGTDEIEELEVVVGSPSADLLVGSSADNVLIGRGGNDRIWGRVGNDQLSGGVGNDRLIGGPASDVASFFDVPGPVTADLIGGIATGAGRDSLITMEGLSGSPAGGDVLRGNSFDNTFYGGGGTDNVLRGRGGFDIANFGDALTDVEASLTDRLATYIDIKNHQSTDALHDIEGLWGSADDDQLEGDGVKNILVGGNGDDLLNGLGDNDYLEGQQGSNTVDGGSGIDILDHISVTDSPVSATLSSPATSTRATGSDAIASVEGLGGGGSSDSLEGDDGPNMIFGDGGVDTINGLVGDDTLVGGAETDTIDGAAGHDICAEAEDQQTDCEEGSLPLGALFDLEQARLRRITERGLSTVALLDNLDRLKHKRLKHKRPPV